MKPYTISKANFAGRSRVSLRERDGLGETLGWVQVGSVGGVFTATAADGLDGSALAGQAYGTRKAAAEALLAATTEVLRPSAPAPHAVVDPSDPAPRVGLGEVYDALDAALDAVASLVSVAQAVLPDEVSRAAFVSLQELCVFKARVNPGATEADPF